MRTALTAELQRMPDPDDPASDTFEESIVSLCGDIDVLRLEFTEEPRLCINLDAHQAGRLIFELHSALKDHLHQARELHTQDPERIGV